MQPSPSAPQDQPPAVRRAERVAVVVACLVLFGVLFAGFARLGSSFGLAVSTSSSVPTAPSEGTQPPAAPGVATATGSLAPSTVGQTPAPSASSSVPSTEPSTALSTVPSAGGASTPTTRPAAVLPARWPVSLPDPGEHEVLLTEFGEEDRWLLAVPGNVPLAGGRFVAGLEDRGWDVRAVSTGRTLTAVGSLEQERVSVTLRPDADLAAGRLLLEVVYQASIPDFEPPSSTTLPPRDQATRRS